MNASNASQYLPFVKALTEGKTVQYFHVYYREWRDAKELDFSGKLAKYRIKPEPPKPPKPQEFFIVRWKDTKTVSGTFATRKAAEGFAGAYEGVEIVRALEVL